MPSKRLALALSLLTAPAGPLAAGDIVAVLTSASGAYMESFTAFQAAYGENVPYFDISEKAQAIPPGTRTVVAFGSKAAALAYPDGVNLVYAAAPGFMSNRNNGPTAKISMLAPPSVLLAELKRLQPRLKKLHILWRSPRYAGLQSEYCAAGRGEGIELVSTKVETNDRLPGLLREARGGMDAFWVPPDPLLITQETFTIFRDFSRANGVPMYVSTKGLARKGACASVGVSFTQIGAAAARAVKRIEKGEALPGVIHAEEHQLILNGSAARYCGLTFSGELIKKADFYFP